MFFGKQRLAIVVSGLSRYQPNIGDDTVVVVRRYWLGDFFIYFDTKDALLNELFIVLETGLFKAIEEAFPFKSDANSQLQHVWSALIEWGASRPADRQALRQLKVSERVTSDSRERCEAQYGKVLDSLETSLKGRVDPKRVSFYLGHVLMRARRHGHIVNISSIGGLVTYPGVGYYHMVKFGLEAMSETLAKEVAPLGIGVTVVAPGAFRTDFRGPASIKQSATYIEDYAGTAGKSREGVQAGHGKQQGDPARGACAIISAVKAERPPVHLLIGGDALDQLRAKLDGLRQETNAWEAVTRGTDFLTAAPRA